MGGGGGHRKCFTIFEQLCIPNMQTLYLIWWRHLISIWFSIRNVLNFIQMSLLYLLCHLSDSKILFNVLFMWVMTISCLFDGHKKYTKADITSLMFYSFCSFCSFFRSFSVYNPLHVSIKKKLMKLFAFTKD